MFHVRWEDATLDQLADIWLAYQEVQREGVNEAVEEIDRVLAADPIERSGDHRVLIAGLLAVLFRLEEDGQTVSVFRVWATHSAH